MESTERGRGTDAHAVSGSYCTDEMGGSDGTGDGSLLLVVGEAFSGEESRATLRDLDDDGGFDIAGGGVSLGRGERGRTANRAASRTALTTEDEVTFWDKD